MFPKKLYREDNFFYRLFLPWLLGFNVMTIIMVFLGMVSGISRWPLVIVNGSLWGFIILKQVLAKARDFQGLSIRREEHDRRRTLLSLAPLILMFLPLFLASLVPLTKIDEIAYHFYYTKMAVLEGSFKLLFSPFALFTYMGTQTYNIWSYSAGAEYGPALNSLFFFGLAAIILFTWARSRFGKLTAVLATLVAFSSLLKGVTCIAPGDNALNFLIILSFMIVSYNIYTQSRKDKDEKFIYKRLLILHLIFVTAIIIKFTNLYLILPMVLFLYISVFSRIKINIKQLAVSFSPFLLFIPFFIRHYLLYGNPIFPAGLNIFGSGPFDRSSLNNALGNLSGSKIGVSRDLKGLLLSPFYYVKDGFYPPMNPNPLFWIFSLLGFIHLIRKRIFFMLIGIVICYIMAFFFLPHYFIRFYLGAVDFLIVLGFVEFLKWIPAGVKKITDRLLKFAVYGSSVIILTGILIYSRQFVFYFFSGEKKEHFLQPRVECYETIKWINKNLPGNALLIVPTRGRYYYNVATEQLYPTAFGENLSIIKNDKGFYAFLKRKGVTHLMDKNRSNQEKVTDLYKLFCRNKRFAKKIYHNDHEVIMGYRNKEPVIGTTAVYKLR